MKNLLHRVFRVGTPGEVSADAGPLLRWGIGLVVVFIGGGLLWMGLAPLDGAVVGEGVVKARTDRVAVIHPKGGMVSVVRVRDGDRVQAGQVLMEFSEPTRLAAFQATRYGHDAEAARNARLRSEQGFATATRFPDELLARRRDAGIAEIIAQEERVFRTRRGTLAEAEAAMRREIGLIRNEGTQLDQRTHTQREAVAASAEQLAANEDLAARGYISKMRVAELRRAHAIDRASVGELEADRIRTEQRIAELELRIAELKNRFLETVSQELKGSDERLFQLAQQLAALRDEVRRDTLTAPIAGAVINLRAVSAGSVIGPLQPICEIVPAGEVTYIEVAVAPKDVRYVQVGNRAEIQVAGWNRRTMPLLEGVVEYVSADVLALTKDQAAFLARVRVGKASGPGPTEPLKPGMQTTVYLRTGPRTLLDYLFEPVIDSMRAAFREP